MDTTRASLERVLATQGLALRGGWVPSAQDVLPGLPDGRAPAVVWMVGQVGSAVWPVFSASRFLRDGLPDPMDRWSKSIGNELARTLDGRALYPSDGPPWLPFQRWAARAEPVRASPLMLQIHPQYGLWHALRFALVLPALDPQDALALQATAATVPVDLCAQCADQPCLQACPVAAFSVGGLDVDACATHLGAAAGADCMERGCQARRACPVGAEHRYQSDHAAFHMAAFALRRGGAAAASLGYHPVPTKQETAMTPEAFAEQLRHEHYDEVFDKTLPAGQYVEAHTHPFAVKALVTQGEVALGVAGIVTTYRVGEVFTMAQGCEHTERYGPQGVSYVVGRKHG